MNNWTFILPLFLCLLAACSQPAAPVPSAATPIPLPSLDVAAAVDATPPLFATAVIAAPPLTLTPRPTVSTATMAVPTAVPGIEPATTATRSEQVSARLEESACVMQRAQRAGWEDTAAILSPDGSRIAWATNPDGNARLHIAAADGRNEILLPAPSQDMPVHDLTWSPDGAWLAFVNRALSQPGGGTIYIVRADGTDLTPTVDYLGYADGLAWSPDGSYLAYSSGDVSGAGSGMLVSNYHIYVTAIDGSRQRVAVTAGCSPQW